MAAVTFCAVVTPRPTGSRRRTATQNFWRGAENLSVTLPPNQIERWAVSQATAYRRMHLRGQAHLWNGYDGWASGGLIVDSKIDGVTVSGSQQQFLTRNSNLAGGWSGSGTGCATPARPTARTPIW